MLIVTAIFTLISTHIYAKFSDKYSTSNVEQVVHNTDAGYQEIIKNITTDRYAICAISINDGAGAALIFLPPGKNSQYDRAYADYKGNDDYESDNRITCFNYSKDTLIEPKRFKVWWKRANDLAVELGGYARSACKGSSCGAKEINADVNVDSSKHSKINRQGIGYKRKVNNDSDKVYFCKFSTENTANELWLVLLPNTQTTLHQIATTNGKNAYDLSCEPVRPSKFTLHAIAKELPNI